MNTAFLENITEKKDLLKYEGEIINKFLLENNLNQIENLQKFFVSSKPLMLVNGFLGTGKGQVVDYSLSLLKSDVIVLRYNCFETTILDDILLKFFDEFKTLVAQNIIKQPKVKSENFTQKVNSYFSVIEQPVVIVLDSFEAVLRDNKQEILDFIFYLSSRNNIKTILISRVFDYNDFENKIDYGKTTVLALEKSVFEKLLRSEGIKLIGPVSDELYRYSRGYFFYTVLSLKMINAHKLSLIDFIKGYTKSFLSYNDFILREALAFVDPVSGHLFRFLTLMRHPVSISLLKTLNLYNEERIKFFIENNILSQENNMIYLQDYYKEISENSIPDSVSVKIHRSCVDLYKSQLPLKPFERDLLISRQTMRTEIEYHSMFLPKTPVLKTLKPLTDTNSLENKNSTKVPLVPDAKVTQEKTIRNISFIFETEESEKMIMDGIAESINNFLDYSNKTLNEEEEKLSLHELVNTAKREENIYNYKKAVALYQRALLKKYDDDFYTFLPLVYIGLSKNFSALSDWFNALRYYDMALEFYISAGDAEKAAGIKLKIADIFYKTFKNDKAKAVLEEIISTSGISSEIIIKAYLLLLNIFDDKLEEAYSYCNKALDLIDNYVNKSVLAELYFKAAVIHDELNRTETALGYYKKCISIEKNNEFLSSAYSNLAMICEEADYKELAEKYYIKSYEIDTDNKNYNGMYLASIKLAILNRKKNPDKALECYKNAVLYAVELKEPFYEISAKIEYGDFCVYRKDFKEALKNYYSALNLAKLHFSSDNAAKIEQRITDMKVRLGVNYEQTEKEILNEG